MRVPTSEASSQTKRSRKSQQLGIRESLSGGKEEAQEQLAFELGKEEREKLLQDSAFSVKLSTEESLAMKASLSLPWKNLRIMRR